MVAVSSPVEGMNGLDVPVLVEVHDGLSRAEVPKLHDGVVSRGGKERAVRVDRDGVDGACVALLVVELLGCFHIPEAPREVCRGRGDEPAERMETDVVDACEVARQRGDFCRAPVERVGHYFQRSLGAACGQDGGVCGGPLETGDLLWMQVGQLRADGEACRVEKVAGAVPGGDCEHALRARVGDGRGEPVGDELCPLQCERTAEEGVAASAGEEIGDAVEGPVCVVLVLDAALGAL